MKRPLWNGFFQPPVPPWWWANPFEQGPEGAAIVLRCLAVVADVLGERADIDPGWLVKVALQQYGLHEDPDQGAVALRAAVAHALNSAGEPA